MTFFSRSSKENTVLISFAKVLLCLELVYLFSAFILKNRHILHSFKLTFRRSRLVLRCCELVRKPRRKVRQRSIESFERDVPGMHMDGELFRQNFEFSRAAGHFPATAARVSQP